MGSESSKLIVKVDQAFESTGYPMAYSKRLLMQLGRPTGLLGRLVLNRLNAVNVDMNQLTLEALDENSGNQVLEIGFGGGALTRSILDSGLSTKYTGLEVSELAISRATKIFAKEISLNTVVLKHYDGAKLPFKKELFSAVCAVNVIYFISDIPALLTQVHRVLEPGGKVVLTYTSSSPDRIKKFPPKTVEKFLTQGSFQVIQTNSGSDQENGDYFCTVAGKG